MIKERNIALCIVLTIVTCGIYGIYWFICMVDELNAAAGEQEATSGIVVFLLGLVTCSIYLFYWYFKAGEKVSRAKEMRAMPSDSNTGILYLLLAIFGLSIVNYCLIQSELNKFAVEG